MHNLLTRLFEPKSNPFEAALLTTTLLNVKISATTLKKEIEEHPNFPSLLSISDVFNNYGLENVGVEFDLDKYSTLPCPFIAQLKGVKDNESFFSVVKSFKEKQVTFFDPLKSKWSVTENEQFLNRCAGVVLLVEAGENTGEKDYDKIVTEEKRKKKFLYLALSFIPALTILTGVLAFVATGINALLPFIFALLTLCGSIATVLLLWYEIDQHNPGLKQICSSGGKKNCSAILQSNAAKIMGISWSVIGSSYFTGLLLLLLFSSLTNSAILSIAAWINASASLYIVFSVYYQWRVAKQWCVLCLSVQAILALQLIIALTGGWHILLRFSDITPDLLIKTIMAFAIPFFATTSLLPALTRVKVGKLINMQLQRLKHDPQVFEALLLKQKRLSVSAEGLGITIGNPHSKNTLIKVCAPYCGPCSKAHPLIEKLIDNNQDIRLQIIFNSYGQGYDTNAIAAKHMLAISEKADEHTIKQALDDWYLPKKKDYEKFAAKYPMNGAVDKQLDKINAMSEWCNKMDLNFTPTFFLNGYQLPNNYSVSDLKYFLSV
ncbi:MAG: vitamin K epoxide reductase family protein [Mucilaginibacter sp.]|uniref:vitamin K epoxide reductase family protein n=1 Tax=Mucilaginibacter sp. TaxID=1882438 RepID=UPI003263C315